MRSRRITDASADGTYLSSPIETTFSGTFEGLGHTISNLSINIYMGNGVATFALFADLSGTIRNIGLLRANVSASKGNANVGTLVGVAEETSTILHSYATGKIWARSKREAGWFVRASEQS